MYITVEEFEKALSPTLRRILSSESDGQQNDTVIEEAIKQASSMIDSYVGYRYIVPLTYTSEQVRAICSDIAMYRLFKRRNAVTDEIIDNYRLSLQFLRDVSQDRALIEGASLKGSDYDTDILNNTYAKSCSDEAKFDEENLTGWEML